MSTKRLTRSHASLPRSVETGTHWAEKRARCHGLSRGGDDLRKFRKMDYDKFDEFDEWIDGDRTMRYSPHDTDARKHLSGWAMRNTNNHNKKVLKKSCLGVLLCSKSCRSLTREITTIRPATSDKARQKQTGKACPNPHCDGKLYHVSCTGKSGYPATHFWRVTDQVILFQSKGVHNHPRPDVVKTTTAAKHALLEYHRRHRNERPKEICKKVGIYIHKSFSRVDRVARQLREVAPSASTGKSPSNSPPITDGQDTTSDSNPYNLRSSYPDSSFHEFWTSPQKAADAPVGKHAAIPSMSASYYHNYQPDPYAHQSLHEDSYITYDDSTSSRGHPTYSPSYQQQSPNPNYNIDSDYHPHQVGPSFTTGPSEYFETKSDMGYSYQPLKQSPRQATIPMCSPEQPHTQCESSQYGYHTSAHSASSSEAAPKVTLKRKAAPHLIPIEHNESKQPRLHKYEESMEMNPIKLSDHTPGINLDLSNFADIFDFSGIVQQDEGLGLAGRPKMATLVASDTSGTQPPHSPPQSPAEEVSSTNGIQENFTKYQPCDDACSISDIPSSAESSPAMEQSADYDTIAQVRLKHPPTTTTLKTFDSHHPDGPGHGDEENEGYINFLVRMYLGKDERQISTLKSEFTVYTSDLQKAYSNRNHGEMRSPHNVYKTHNGQYEFSWYNKDSHHRGYHSSGPHSPFNVSAKFEYPVNHHSDYVSSKHDRSYYQ